MKAGLCECEVKVYDSDSESYGSGYTSYSVDTECSFYTKQSRLSARINEEESTCAKESYSSTDCVFCCCPLY